MIAMESAIKRLTDEQESINSRLEQLSSDGPNEYADEDEELDREPDESDEKSGAVHSATLFNPRR